MGDFLDSPSENPRIVSHYFIQGVKAPDNRLPSPSNRPIPPGCRAGLPQVQQNATVMHFDAPSRSRFPGTSLFAATYCHFIHYGNLCLLHQICAGIGTRCALDNGANDL